MLASDVALGTAQGRPRVLRVTLGSGRQRCGGDVLLVRLAKAPLGTRSVRLE